MKPCWKQTELEALIFNPPALSRLDYNMHEALRHRNKQPWFRNVLPYPPAVSDIVRLFIGPVAAAVASSREETDENSSSKTDFWRSEEHTSEIQSLMRISYAVFCLKKKKKQLKQLYSVTRKAC